MKYARRPYSKVAFQEENVLKEDCMTLNHNFLRKWQIFGKRKANKTQRNFEVFGSRKIPSMFYMKSFSRKTRSKGSKTFPKQENFLQKIQGKILKEGFQDFPRTPSKKNAPFPKSFLENPQKFIRKSPKILLKNHQKVSPRITKESPLFTTQTTIL